MAPKLEEWEIKKYWEIFSGLKPVGNKLSGDKVSPVFKNSQLSQDKLTKIWDLADIDVDGSLDFEEFCIAMRLIFDLVNGTVSSVPQSLPDWLIPSSKSHLVQADRAVYSNTNDDANYVSGDEDEELALSSDFDWYISPNDKAAYETVYASSCDRYGRIKFDMLSDLYKTLPNVPETAVSSAWNLVNPKQFETIDKDQCLVFLHILNQRSNGKRVPRGVPASLRATFSKEMPEYDINSHQGDVYTSNNNHTSSSNTKKGFAESYLSKMGSNNAIAPSSGTDFTATKGTDWEEVRLRRELADLEKLLDRAEEESRKKSDPDAVDDKLAMAKYEFEQLLKYKETELKEISSGSRGATDIRAVMNDIELVESQLASLESFLGTKQEELRKIKEEVASARA